VSASKQILEIWRDSQVDVRYGRTPDEPLCSTGKDGQSHPHKRLLNRASKVMAHVETL
jgi:hypothetical protein